MRSDKYVNKPQNIISFLVVFLISSILAGFLISFIWHDDETGKVDKVIVNSVAPLKNNNLQANLSTLLMRMNDLNKSDKEYTHLLLTSPDKNQLDSVDKIIKKYEKSLRITFDSVKIVSAYQKDAGSGLILNDILSLYRTILENRNTYSNLRQTIYLKKDLNVPDSAIIQAQN